MQQKTLSVPEESKKRFEQLQIKYQAIREQKFTIGETLDFTVCCATQILKQEKLNKEGRF